MLQFSTVIKVLNQKNIRNRITYHTHYVVNVVEEAPEEHGLRATVDFLVSVKQHSHERCAGAMEALHPNDRLPLLFALSI